MSVEVAPSQVRCTVFIPPTLFFVPLSVIVGEPACAQYLPPVFRYIVTQFISQTVYDPPQMIISLPVQIAVKTPRKWGAPMVLVAVQPSVLGSYRPPVAKLLPPQTTISLPVHTAE